MVWQCGLNFSGATQGPGSEADHSPQTIAEIKTTLIYISTPRYIFMA